jgi:hypothetical protein
MLGMKEFSRFTVTNRSVTTSFPTKMRKASNASSIAIRSSRGLFEMILVTNIYREVNF